MEKPKPLNIIHQYKNLRTHILKKIKSKKTINFRYLTLNNTNFRNKPVQNSPNVNRKNVLISDLTNKNSKINSNNINQVINNFGINNVSPREKSENFHNYVLKKEPINLRNYFNNKNKQLQNNKNLKKNNI